MIQLIIPALLLVMSACSPGPSAPGGTTASEGVSQLSETPSPAPSSTEDQVKRSAEDILKGKIEPSSLVIKEFCTTDIQCQFRGHCHGIQVTLSNPTDTTITITRVVRETMDEIGHTEDLRTLDLSEKPITLEPHSDLVFPGGRCTCRTRDRVCTPEYPHRTIAFLYGKTVRLTFDYQGEDGAIGFLIVDGRYRYERQQ